MCYKSNRDAALLEVRLKSTGILCLHVFSKSGYTFERGGGLAQRATVVALVGSQGGSVGG